MLYRTLRSAARVALHWYYSDVIVQGRERVPSRGPVLVVANHPNALVDVLLVVTAVHRRVLLTAKATLFEHPALSPLLGVLGVIPLRRAKDARPGVTSDTAASRNADAFRLVTDAFRRERVVLVFPEGISHDAPSLAPFRSGAARMLLQAQKTGTRGLHVLPVGLVFEEKERPRSRVLVRIGPPLDIDSWCATHAADDVAALTRELETCLRQVTLNFATAERAARAVRVARALAALADEAPSLGAAAVGETFAASADIAARVERATDAFAHASPAVARAADVFSARLDALEARFAARGAALADSRISLRLRHGARFAIREVTLSILALPIAALGRVTHWLPIHIAQGMALRSVARDPSRDQPAMRTILLGVAAVLLWYAIQAVVVTRWLGGVAAVLWLVTIFLSAQIDLLLEERLRHALRRTRTYLVLRADPALQASLRREVDGLLEEAMALEQALIRGIACADGPSA